MAQWLGVGFWNTRSPGFDSRPINYVVVLGKTLYPACLKDQVESVFGTQEVLGLIPGRSIMLWSWARHFILLVSRTR